MTADDIRVFMKERALSASALAQSVGISRGRMRKILNNQIPVPPWFDRYCAAEAYKLPPYPFVKPGEKP